MGFPRHDPSKIAKVDSILNHYDPDGIRQGLMLKYGETIPPGEGRAETCESPEKVKPLSGAML